MYFIALLLQLCFIWPNDHTLKGDIGKIHEIHLKRGVIFVKIFTAPEKLSALWKPFYALADWINNNDNDNDDHNNNNNNNDNSNNNNNIFIS